ncbi:MAG: hypothetical protein WCE78_08300 [Pseudonocardiaceae bacterium]
MPINPFVIGNDIGYRKNPLVPNLGQHVAANPSQATMRIKEKIMGVIRPTGQPRAPFNIPN